MKIYKYIHSCLVIEKEGFKLLIDPGKFSFAERLVNPKDFSGISAVIIIHNHPDHLDKENLQAILKLSNAVVYTNAEVSAELLEEGIKSELLPYGDFALGPIQLEVLSVKHEAILDSPLPEMIALVIDGRVLHPFDSFEDILLDYKGIELLILPIMAPFTTELVVATFAGKVKPKQILPVHDGYAKAFFLKQRYENYGKHFEKSAIAFHKISTPSDFIEI